MLILNDTLFPFQKKGTILLYLRYIICIDIFTITQCVLFTSFFNFKAVFFIDFNCWGVIDKHGQFNAIYLQLVVAHFNYFLHQGAGDAAVFLTRVDTDTKIGNMTAAWALLHVNGEMAHDVFINTGDELLDAGTIGELLLLHMIGRMRHLQCVAIHFWLGVNLLDGFVILCFCVAYYYFTYFFAFFGVNVFFNIIDF